MESLENSVSVYHTEFEHPHRRATLPGEITTRDDVDYVTKIKKMSIPNYEAEVTEKVGAGSDWKEFTSNTTFHGIRYIFIDGPLRIRRCFYHICIQI